MGNLTTIIPTKNKENFNRDYIIEKLKENFSEFIFEVKGNQVTVRKDIKNMRDFVTNIYFNTECSILNIDKDISELEDIKKDSDRPDYWNNLINELKYLKEIGYDEKNCIETTYGFWNGDKSDIDFFIRDLFNGYIFDEGIHPEFMGPSYIRREPAKKKSFIKRFLNF